MTEEGGSSPDRSEERQRYEGEGGDDGDARPKELLEVAPRPSIPQVPTAVTPRVRQASRPLSLEMLLADADHDQVDSSMA